MSLPTSAVQRGVTLIELLLAVAISAILLAALNGLVKLGLDTQTSVRAGNELAYQGRFALERLADKARSTAPKLLATPAANTTGDWFAPAGCTGAACVMVCLNAAKQLIETTTTDTGCTGSTVIANSVSAFSAALPAATGPVDPTGPVDRQTGVFTLSLSSGSTTLALSASVLRFGGGTQ